MRIPLASPDVTEADVAAVVEVLRSGRLSLGPRLEAFENAAATFLGAPGAVAVNSGTSGLHICLRALGIGPGDEVITTAFSFAASATSLLYERAVPVFVDVDPDTWAIDPRAIEAALTPRTRALLVVHVFGRPAPMREINAIASRCGLLVIEDACEAFGAEADGRKVGTLGDAGVFAFYPNKQITTAEGGLVVAREPARLDHFRRLRNQGRDPGAGWFQHVELGYSYRLSDVHAALGLSQLERIDAVLERRERIAAEYRRRLSGCAELHLPPPARPGERVSWFTYVVRLADALGRQDRDRVVERMASRGIECGRYFAPIHLQPVFRDASLSRGGPLQVTESVADRALALPFFHRITAEELDLVCDTLVTLVSG